MADGGSDCRSGVVTEQQNLMDQKSLEILFKHFRKHNLEIAIGIARPFALLTILRDHAFISGQDCEISTDTAPHRTVPNLSVQTRGWGRPSFQEALRNRIPVKTVMFQVFSELERFDLSLLRTVFTRTDLMADSDLNNILKRFPQVSQELALLMDGEKDSEDGEKESEDISRLLLCNGEEASGKQEDQQLNKEGEAEELNSSLPGYDGQAEQSARENEKCSCVMCFSKDAQEGPGARMKSSQADAVGTGNTTSRKPKRKRKKRGHGWSKIGKRKHQIIHREDRSTDNGPAVSSGQEVGRTLRGPVKKVRGRKRGRPRTHLTRNVRAPGRSPVKRLRRKRKYGILSITKNRISRALLCVFSNKPIPSIL